VTTEKATAKKNSPSCVFLFAQQNEVTFFFFCESSKKKQNAGNVKF
jgi:hypothetical protein